MAGGKEKTGIFQTLPFLKLRPQKEQAVGVLDMASVWGK